MSYATLSESALARVMGSMLTTYYRDKHRTGGRLRAVHDLRISPTGAPPLVADVAIIEPRRDGPGRIVALYEVVTTMREKESVAAAVQQLRSYLARYPATPPIELGIVVPESREAELSGLAPGLSVVTYPG